MFNECLTNTIYAMDPNISVLKRLWCTRNVNLILQELNPCL